MADLIQSEAELEDRLSSPSPEDVALFREMEGDLLIIGVAGKMGPSLACRAVRAARAAGVKKRILGVSRFSEPAAKRSLEQAGVETLGADLLDPASFATLPEAANVIFMAGRKFGSTGAESLTWAMNAYLPRVIPQTIVAFAPRLQPICCTDQPLAERLKVLAKSSIALPVVI